MSSLSYPEATVCGAGVEGKTEDELVEHFREFVRKVWESECPPGLVLVLRPEIVQTAKGRWLVKMTDDMKKLRECAEKVVYFLTAEQLKRSAPEGYELYRKKSIRIVAVLVKETEDVRKCVGLEMGVAKATLVKWFASLQRKNDECVVCYEQTGFGAKKTSSCFRCAANVCLQCYIDISLDAELVVGGENGEREYHCPLCAGRRQVSFSRICYEAVVDKTLSEAHKEFAAFWNSVESLDYSDAIRNSDFQRMTAKMRNAIEIDFESLLRRFLRIFERKLRISRTKKHLSINRSNVDTVRFCLRTYLPILRQTLRECDAAKVKKPLKSASDDSIASGSAVPNRVRSDRCARCQKVFWDKKEKKRAPKCPKCKRVAYCSGVCRKKHRATHKLQCEAGAKAKSKKKAAAKAAKLYGR